MSDHPMTLNGKKLIESELEQLIKVEREKLKVAIAEARANGDLKENADYQAAKERQSHVEGRIMELQGKLAGAKIVDVSKLNGERVVFGATVQVYHNEKEEMITYQIVGDDEAQTGNNKISYASPLARALIGKQIGDEIIVKAPKGDVHYTIEDVLFISN
jgi:transcription elongation factor GreA